MTNAELAVLCLTSALGGGINAVAGGGTLLTFPALIAALAKAHPDDTAKVIANGTSTVALFPASVTALWGLRREYQTLSHWAARLVPPSIVGGVAGTLLVTQLDEKIFANLVPWLILIAASLFALQPIIAKRLGIGKSHEEPHGKTVVGVMLFQFAVGVYGGYFGAGIGILMLSALAMMGMSDIHAMNGLKSLLGSCINGSAVAIWIWAGKVDWSLAAPMALSGCVGAFLAAHYSRKLPRALVRWFVICVGFTLATYYFVRG
ncbi:MAG: sulfite exporter TauE/SafE family protein [Planctomycetaceae bacterium]|nr:sulfite exporter TauE/SafE family protein [Planctomycetaceae bacterium]